MNNLLIALIVISALALIGIVSILSYLITQRLRAEKAKTKTDEIIKNEIQNHLNEINNHIEIKLDKLELNQKGFLAEIIGDKINNLKNELNKTINEFGKSYNEIINNNLVQIASVIKESNKVQNEDLNKLSNVLRENVNTKLEDITKRNREWFEEIKTKIDKHFEDKLTKQINEHFNNIKSSMDEMNKGMTEFSTIQKSVIDLNKAFSNNKTVGNFGEFSLRQILENHFPSLKNNLWFEQYKIDPKSDEKVDFVIRSKNIIDGKEQEIIIPIDSKFPLDTWNKYIDKENEVDKKDALKKLRDKLKEMAKSIRDKYIKPYHNTTPFAILFLPSESIHLTLIQDNNFIPAIFNDYKILIIGPSFMMAFIYSYSVQNQNYRVAKDIEKIKDLFIEIQNKYNVVNNNIIDGLESIGQASKKIGKAYKYTNEVINKISKNSNELGIPAPVIKETTEKKKNKINALISDDI
ncbi:DNA recombination protein RmuC [Mycoplasma sp. 332]|uniref:DNA recombination protein RmuC n=1 Tax=Mycoplasma sp. 332 TaxID=3458236 RepID=UPI00403630F8